MATKLAIGRSAIRPRGDVPQVTHRSQKICAVAAQPDTGNTRELRVHSLRISSRLPTDR
jgi:23S rRNA-/tRNA-specific pseudouridylate synthase